MPKPDDQTIRRLQVIVEHFGTLRKAADALGFPESYAPIFSAIIKGKENSVSRTRENEIRQKLNLFPLGASRISDVPRAYLRFLIIERGEYVVEPEDLHDHAVAEKSSG